MYKLKCSVLLIVLCGVVVNSSPLQQYCRPHQIEATKEKYIKKLWDEADDLEDIDELLVEIKVKAQRKLNELEEKVSFVIEFANENGFDIEQCLDFDYINNIPVDVTKQLDKLVGWIENGSKNLVAYVKKSIKLIDYCGGLHVSCKRIERCCENVVDDFDDDVIEDGVEHLEEVSERQLRSILRKIDNDIKNILEETDLCYIQHLQSTTTVGTTEQPVQPTEPAQSTATEAPVQETTTEEPTEEITTEESAQETTTEELVEPTESVQETTESPVETTTSENEIVEPTPE